MKASCVGGSRYAKGNRIRTSDVLRDARAHRGSRRVLERLGRSRGSVCPAGEEGRRRRRCRERVSIRGSPSRVLDGRGHSRSDRIRSPQYSRIGLGSDRSRSGVVPAGLSHFGSRLRRKLQRVRSRHQSDRHARHAHVHMAGGWSRPDRARPNRRNLRKRHRARLHATEGSPRLGPSSGDQSRNFR